MAKTETPIATLMRVQDEHQSRLNRISAVVSRLPMGTSIEGYTLQRIGGDLLWISDKGGMDCSQIWQQYPNQVAEALCVDRYDWESWA